MDAGSLNSNVIIRLARWNKFDLCRELAVDAFRVTTENVTTWGGGIVKIV